MKRGRQANHNKEAEVKTRKIEDADDPIAILDVLSKVEGGTLNLSILTEGENSDAQYLAEMWEGENSDAQYLAEMWVRAAEFVLKVMHDEPIPMGISVGVYEFTHKWIEELGLEYRHAADDVKYHLAHAKLELERCQKELEELTERVEWAKEQKRYLETVLKEKTR